MTVISIKRLIIYILEIILFFIIHDIEFIVIAYYNAKPIVTISIAISIAIYERNGINIILGAICGLLVDISIGNIMGINALILCIICFIISKIKIHSFIIYIIYTAFSVTFMLYITFVLSPYELNFYNFKSLYIPNIIYTIIVSPLFYIINKKIYLKVR